MCTLIIASRVFDGVDLLAVDNRDEVLDRPAEPPRLHRRGQMAIFAPRDLKAGGTWVGLNRAGVFAAVTNRFRQSSQEHQRSRGELVFDALQRSNADDAARLIEALAPGDYAGFHFVVADGQTLAILWNDGEAIRRLDKVPGVYVITERSFDAAPSSRLRRLQTRVGELPDEYGAAREQIVGWMKEHDRNAPLESTCVHLPQRNYGTRSSTIVEVGTSWHFLHADGPPCKSEYRSYDEAISNMRSEERER